MICNISLEEFKIPIVLSCGHTFEKEYIENSNLTQKTTIKLQNPPKKINIIQYNKLN